MRLTLTPMLILLVPLAAAHANDPAALLTLLPPAELESQATATAGPSGEPAVQVTGSDKRTVTKLIVIDAPKLASDSNVIRGQVKYDGVVGDGYLELQTDFGGWGTYFPRSRGDKGLTRTIKGSSDWREFELPVYKTSGMRLQRLSMQLVLPGPGTVVIAAPKLCALDEGDWWSEPRAGLVGGIGGSALGLLGAAVGVLSNLRKFRRLTLTLMGVGIGIGLMALVVGVAAISAGQPWHVYYPLMQVGALCGILMGIGVLIVRRRYRDEDLRRMTALDA